MRETLPPGMPSQTFQFLRGISAAIELCREHHVQTMERILFARHPQVRAIRDDGVRSVGLFATHTLQRGGEPGYGLVVKYSPPDSPLISGPSDCDWLVPTR